MARLTIYSGPLKTIRKFESADMRVAGKLSSGKQQGIDALKKLRRGQNIEGQEASADKAVENSLEAKADSPTRSNASKDKASVDPVTQQIVAGAEEYKRLSAELASVVDQLSVVQKQLRDSTITSSVRSGLEEQEVALEARKGELEAQQGEVNLQESSGLTGYAASRAIVDTRGQIAANQAAGVLMAAAREERATLSKARSAAPNLTPDNAVSFAKQLAVNIVNTARQLGVPQANPHQLARNTVYTLLGVKRG